MFYSNEIVKLPFGIGARVDLHKEENYQYAPKYHSLD